MLKKENGIYILTVSGTHYEIGVQHGEALKDVIEEAICKWKKIIKDITGENPEQVISEFVSKTKILNSVKAESPCLYEEVRGIASGCGIEEETIFAYHLFDDITGYLIENYGLEDAHCTTIGIKRKGSNIVAGNCDILSCYENAQVMMHVKYKDSDLEILTFTFAGMIAQGGVNNRGVSMMMNTLLDANSQNEGIPSAFIARSILEKENIDSVIEFLKATKHSFGMHYLVGDFDRIVSVECSKNEVAVMDNKDEDCVVHTNHCLYSKDISNVELKDSNSAESTSSFALTYERYEDAKIILEKNVEKNVDLAKKILCTEPMYKVFDGIALSAASIIVESKPGYITMEFAAFPFSEDSYSKFEF